MSGEEGKRMEVRRGTRRLQLDWRKKRVKDRNKIKLPPTPSAQASAPYRVYPVKGQCFISSNLNRLHLLHHQYSSQHPMGHFVADRNFPTFSPSKDQNTISWLPWLLALVRILSIIVWDPDTQTSLVFPFLFRICLLLWRPHHIQKLVCSVLVFRALENSLWAI